MNTTAIALLTIFAGGITSALVTIFFSQAAAERLVKRAKAEEVFGLLLKQRAAFAEAIDVAKEVVAGTKTDADLSAALTKFSGTPNSEKAEVLLALYFPTALVHWDLGRRSADAALAANDVDQAKQIEAISKPILTAHRAAAAEIVNLAYRINHPYLFTVRSWVHALGRVGRAAASKLRMHKSSTTKE